MGDKYQPKAAPQMNMLTAYEFRKLIARMGGLWTGGALDELFGARARNWPSHKEFPDHAWLVGKSHLYSGWEVWQWLLDTNKHQEAGVFKEHLEALGRRKWDA
jgi:hypothetical protein